MDTKVFKIGVLSCLSLFCIQGLSIASTNSSINKDKFQTTQANDKSKYYGYIDAIFKDGKNLTPTQIRAIDEYKREINQARHEQPHMSYHRNTLIYSDDKPPTIRIGVNRLSTITFVDNAGNPYPIQSYVVSDPKSFSVSERSINKKPDVRIQDHQDNGINYQDYINKKTPTKVKQNISEPTPDKVSASMLNSLTVKGQNSYSSGDLIVYLDGKQDAIHIFLDSSDKQYDYQSNITVDGLTQASISSISSTGEDDIGQPSKILMQFLNGTPPKDAVSKDITLNNSQAWSLGKYFYIRTKSELQSPAYISRVSTSNNFHVFKIPNTSHVLNVVDHQKLKVVYINDSEIEGSL
jgi:hypothetical protein